MDERSGEITWQNGDPAALSAGVAHIWRADLDAARADLAALRDLLSPDEQQRADRFRFAADAERWIAARGTLRRLLGRYLGAEPAALRFNYGRYGKPALAATPLYFSVAHSAGLALYALAWERELGVDLEQMRPMNDLAMLVEHYFAPEEREGFARLDEEARLPAFFGWWTRKEALLKATGQGLSGPLRAVVVPEKSERPVVVPSVGEFYVDGFAAAPGFAAALAVAEGRLSAHYFGWPNSPAR